jgi:hypothetical protein
MARSIYLAVFSNAYGPSHWAIWIPTGGQGEKGKLIQVIDAGGRGFDLQFKRNYDFGYTRMSYQIFHLAQVQDRFVADASDRMPPTVDATARDHLESAATVVPPPRRSPNPQDPGSPDCQTWVIDFVEKLIADRFVDPSARAVLQSAPRRI